MDNERTLEIIKALLVGKNPFTGEIYDKEHILKNPEVTSALFGAFVAVRKNSLKDKPPVNAGKSWGYNEDLQLITEFKSGNGLIDIANTHQRTVGAIRSRLVKLLGENILIEYKEIPIKGIEKCENDNREHDAGDIITFGDDDSINDIYNAISDGSGEPAYLGDGVWIEADGSLHDRGR